MQLPTLAQHDLGFTLRIHCSQHLIIKMVLDEYQLTLHIILFLSIFEQLHTRIDKFTNPQAPLLHEIATTTVAPIWRP